MRRVIAALAVVAGTFSAVAPARADLVPALGTSTVLETSGASAYGDSVTLTATVKRLVDLVPVSTGTVTFSDLLGGPLAGCADKPVSLSGVATCSVSSLTAGAHGLRASYTGDGLLASEGDVVQTVNKAAMTVTANPRSITFGDALPTNLTATLSGPVALLPTGVPACAIGGTPSNAGEYLGAITCTAGTLDVLNFAFDFVAGNLTIAKVGQSISFPAVGGMTYGEADKPLSATATSGLPVDVASSTPAVCTVVAGKVHVVSAGDCTLAATQIGDLNHLAAALVQQILTIAKAPLTLTASPITITSGDALPAPAGTLTGFVNGENLGTSGITGAAACAGPTPLPTAAGAYSGAITCLAGTLAALNYAITSLVPGLLTILAAVVPEIPGTGGTTGGSNTTNTTNVTNVGITGGGTGAKTPAAPTLLLLTPTVKPVKRVKLKLHSSGEMKLLAVALKRNGKSLARGALASLDGNGTVTLKAARKLKKGVYTLEATWVDAAGRKGKRRFNIRVR
jgi:hypothetical protein